MLKTQIHFRVSERMEKILTLSNGKFEELFDQQDIQQIGTALVNVRSMKVVKLMEEKEASNRLDNTSSGRFLSVDPLTSSFPFYSPYQYAGIHQFKPLIWMVLKNMS